MSRARFCKLMNVNRSTLYYKNRPEKCIDATIRELIDKHYMNHCTAGVKSMVNMLKDNGLVVNPKKVRKMMRMMNIHAVYPTRSLSKSNGPVQYVAPYLLRGLSVTKPNQVWSTDISYIHMKNGFMYVYAVIDVYSRYIVGWTLSNSLSASVCVELIEDCISRCGVPGIINTDQGCQYTGALWKNTLDAHGIAMSMDGKGRCKDNIWIERFWRTLKQDVVYTKPTCDCLELRTNIADFVDYYNYHRRHQGINNLHPSDLYHGSAA